VTYTVVYVGDPHVVVDELEECRRLVDAIRAFALNQKATRVVFLGDQTHNHSTARLEVLHFWRQAFLDYTA